jgi:hypothetical protein
MVALDYVELNLGSTVTNCLCALSDSIDWKSGIGGPCDNQKVSRRALSARDIAHA